MSGARPRPEVLSFLRAIKDHPEDDTPRLILADWLEEKGDDADVARAQLLRAQVESARLPPYHPRRLVLESRARQLCQSYQSAWLGPLAGGVRQAWLERGLLRLEAHAGRFISRRMAALVGSEAYAWLESVRFPALASSGLGKLVTLPLLRSISALEVQPHWSHYRSSFPLADLFRCEHVAGLRALRLISCYHQEDALVQLAVSPYLSSLTSLCIWGGSLDKGALAALAQSTQLTRLTSLDLSACISDSIQELANSPVLRGVTSLSLRHNRLNNTSLAHLASSPFCRSLTRLDLAGCAGITASGIAHLVGSPHLTELRALDLSLMRIGGEGVRILAGSPHLPRLTTLRLAGSPYAQDWHRVDDEAATILVQSPYLTQLTSLDLPNNRLGLRTALALASSSTLTQLTSLNLAGNHIGHEGTAALARSPILANVIFLDLSGNHIRRTGARALAESPYLQPGVTLRLVGNRLNAVDRVMLRKRFGDRVELSAYPQVQRK